MCDVLLTVLLFPSTSASLPSASNLASPCDGNLAAGHLPSSSFSVECTLVQYKHNNTAAMRTQLWTSERTAQQMTGTNSLCMTQSPRFRLPALISEQRCGSNKLPLNSKRGGKSLKGTVKMSHWNSPGAVLAAPFTNTDTQPSVWKRQKEKLVTLGSASAHLWSAEELISFCLTSPLSAAAESEETVRNKKTIENVSHRLKNCAKSGTRHFLLNILAGNVARCRETAGRPQTTAPPRYWPKNSKPFIKA